MTKLVNQETELTPEELEIAEHARAKGVHIKKAGRHSGHCWYCFDCHNCTTDHILDVPFHATQVDHKSFDSNEAIKTHLLAMHGVHIDNRISESEEDST